MIMKSKSFASFGILTSLAFLSTSSYALEDGVYKGIGRKGNCNSNADVTIFVESDKPINLSLIPGGTGYIQNPQK